MKRAKRGFVAALVIVAVSAIGASAEEGTVRVAAAADLKFAMTELMQEFQKHSAARIDITYGSSGNFFSQIQNGAPFDLFFSADVEYPKKLAAGGAADAATLYEYAVGRIVIWTPREAKPDVTRDKWKTLLDASVQKIAIANPQHAPYGRAAVAAMQKAGVYEQAQSKLVFGENISQAAQFVQSGSAQAGILALSLALSPPMKDGKYWLIPADMHAPIKQGAIVLQSGKSNAAAKAFLDFVRSTAGKEILARFGFQFPAAGEKQS